MAVRREFHIPVVGPSGPPIQNVLNVLEGDLLMALGVGQEPLLNKNVPADAVIQLTYFGAAAAVDGGILTGEIGVDGLGNPALNVFSTNAVDGNLVFWRLEW